MTLSSCKKTRHTCLFGRCWTSLIGDMLSQKELQKVFNLPSGKIASFHNLTQNSVNFGFRDIHYRLLLTPTDCWSAIGCWSASDFSLLLTSQPASDFTAYFWLLVCFWLHSLLLTSQPASNFWSASDFSLFLTSGLLLTSACFWLHSLLLTANLLLAKHWLIGYHWLIG